MRKIFIKYTFFLSILIIVIFLSSLPASSQPEISLNIDEVNDTNFPIIDVQVTVSDAQNYPVSGLTEDNFKITENGASVSDFTVTPLYEKPLSIVLLIDQSKSMGYDKPPAISTITKTLKQFSQGLSLEDEVAVVTFGDKVSIAQDLTTDKVAIYTALDSIQLQDNAMLNDGIMEAARIVKGLSGRTVIVLFTDGEDSGYSQYTFNQVIDEVVRQNIFIFPISWRSANLSDLQKLANLSRGKSWNFGPGNSDEAFIQGTLNELLPILKNLREQYKVTFTSNSPADGKEHEFILRVNYMGGEEEDVGRLMTRLGEVKVSLPELVEGQSVGGKLRFAPKVEAPAPLAEVEILIDGQPLTSPLLAEPFEYIFDTTTISEGMHTFEITARDTIGNQGKTVIQLNIVPPLTVRIKEPADGSTLAGSVLISAEATTLSQISKVDFSVDSKPLSSDSEPPYEAQWNLKDVPAGSHEISVFAYDINGYSASDKIRIVVAVQNRYSIVYIAILAVVVVAGVLIPVGLRQRRKAKARSLVESKGGMEAMQPGPIGVALLRELQGLNENQVWPLEAAEIRLGRKKDENDIPLQGLRASRQHAVIRRYESDYVIFSLKEENPVLVNNEPVIQQVLKPGDIIQAGESTFRFES